MFFLQGQGLSINDIHKIFSIVNPFPLQLFSTYGKDYLMCLWADPTSPFSADVIHGCSLMHSMEIYGNGRRGRATNFEVPLSL